MLVLLPIKTVYFWEIKVTSENYWERLDMLLIKDNPKVYNAKNKFKLSINSINQRYLRKNL